jgi:hypothetical protein
MNWRKVQRPEGETETAFGASVKMRRTKCVKS